MLNEREIEKIKKDREFKQVKEKQIAKERKFFIKLFALLAFLIVALLSVLIYFIVTADERAEKQFDSEILGVFQIVLQEHKKRVEDPYYEYYGLDVNLRKSSKEKEYADISRMLQTDIDEDFYILSDEELEYLGSTIKGTFLVNYDKTLAFSLEPFKYEDGSVKYTLDELLHHYTVSKDIDSSGANLPVLLDGMTPVVYNNVEELWEFVENPDEDDWYNYEKKMWANVMLQDYTDNDSSNVDGSMFVWIPRYAYKIEKENYHTSNAGLIDIKFLVDNTNTTYDGIDVNPNNTNSSNDYVIHPAFRAYGDVAGIWVSKFEASTHEYGDEGQGANDTNNVNLTYKSFYDKYTWTNIDMNNEYIVAKNMINNEIYGLNPQQANTHMMKNTEWGAVAYLTQSKYGNGISQVWSNNYYDEFGTKTGYSARSSTDTKYGDSVDDVTFLWNTNNGVNASTTGNVYGVYDMVGGAIERMSAYLDNNNKYLKDYGKALLEEKNSSYYDVYKPGIPDSRETNYEIAKSKYGDAIYETSSTALLNSKSSWYSASSTMMNNEYPFIFRGGSCATREESGVGLYYYSPSSGGPNKYSTFRVVISQI